MCIVVSASKKILVKSQIPISYKLIYTTMVSRFHTLSKFSCLIKLPAGCPTSFPPVVGVLVHLCTISKNKASPATTE